MLISSVPSFRDEDTSRADSFFLFFSQSQRMGTELTTRRPLWPARPEALGSTPPASPELGAANWATQPGAHDLPAGS